MKNLNTLTGGKAVTENCQQKCYYNEPQSLISHEHNLLIILQVIVLKNSFDILYTRTFILTKYLKKNSNSKCIKTYLTQIQQFSIFFKYLRFNVISYILEFILHRNIVTIICMYTLNHKVIKLLCVHIK